MLISILIPAYKKKYLKECIQSIIKQTYENWEIIILNDKSPQNLESVVGLFLDDRIKYYKNEKNVGAINLVDNWNKCLSYAEGDYVMCIGDDDVLLPNCIEEYSKLILKHPGLGVYHAWTEIIDEKGKFIRLLDARPERESVYSLIWHRWNGRTQFIGDFLFHTETLRKLGGFHKLPLAWGADDISVYIAAKDGGIANSQNVMFQYRSSQDTITNTGNVELKVEAIQGEKEWINQFLEQKPNNKLYQKFHTLITEKKDRHYHQKMLYLMRVDFRKHGLIRLRYWSKIMSLKAYTIEYLIAKFQNIFEYLKIRK